MPAAGVPLTRADELNGYEAVDELFFGGAGQTARYVLRDLKGNDGDTTYLGLLEVQFLTIPEPATFVLLGLGLVLVPPLRRRTRRQL